MVQLVTGSSCKRGDLNLDFQRPHKNLRWFCDPISRDTETGGLLTLIRQPSQTVITGLDPVSKNKVESD